MRFVRLDLPGFGGTPLATAPSPGLDARGAFVAAAIAALGIERCVLIGHSMGGGVALSAAVLAPTRVAALGRLASVGLRPHVMLRRLVGRRVFARAIDVPLEDLGEFRAPLVVARVRLGRARVVDAQPDENGTHHPVNLPADFDLAHGAGSHLIGRAQLVFTDARNLWSVDLGQHWSFPPGGSPRWVTTPLVSPDGRWAACAEAQPVVADAGLPLVPAAP